MASPEFTTEEIAHEIWLPVPGFEQLYVVSNLGRLRNTRSRQQTTKAGRILFGSADKAGYIQAILYDYDGKRRHRFIHRVVAAAFLGPCPVGYQVNHKDFNKANNQLSNLEYCSSLENVHHAMANGRIPMARRKLTDDQIRAIRELSKTKYPTELSRMFGVSVSAIESIRRGRSWKHLR
jgi:hypothetical protein